MQTQRNFITKTMRALPSPSPSPSPSDLIPSQIERAWYLLTALLRLGRPARPTELNPDPDLVHSLCRIHGSPLFLDKNGFVTVSESAIGCFCRFWTSLVASPVLRSGDGFEMKWKGLIYTRKRKARGFEVLVPGREAKRKLLIDFETDVEESKKEKDVSNQLVPVSGSEYDISTKEVPFHVNPEFLQNFFKSNPVAYPIRGISFPTNQNMLEENNHEFLQAPTFSEAEIHEEMPLQFFLETEPVPLLELEPSTNLNAHENCINIDQNEKLDGKDNEVKEVGTSKEKKDLIKEQEFEFGTEPVDKEENRKKRLDADLKDQDKRVDKDLLLKKNMKKINAMKNMRANKANEPHGESKSQAEPKLVPNLESFIIEEEEGSGGYGTVYKARRKSDGKIFAVKCPHKNAHSHHVNNEMKMLERFGGRNYVIRYEGSFQSGNLECFILQHVEHDRPEVLKKEITVWELMWYGFCLIKALSSLHKQGIVHRDVKPGNFLFSRELAKGYLIDFNLATDLHQRFLRNATAGTSTDPFSLPSQKPSSSNSQQKGIQIQIPVSKRKRSNSNKTNNQAEQIPPKIETKKRHKNQTADSGVTSAKDQTSTRNSQERRNQPILYSGFRKELLHFINDSNSKQSPKKEVRVQEPVPVQVQAIVPASQRKRVAAPFQKMNTNLAVFTPMPLYSSGVAVAGSGVFKSKEGRHRKEGPCVGTKGFRAPEVLFKSFHQNCKVDMWSAGVTLLYLIIGRSPFAGDPEQNAKEIAKLRGSEDLWEVAKLHNCESSFPSDLFDIRYLQPVDLKDWCAANTRRPEFLKLIPDSLFDLIEKCLTVNPRKRISSEEALLHNFFSPCLKALKRTRVVAKNVNNSEQSAI